MNTTKYSVLIRTFNSEKTLSVALDSLRSQTAQPSEYIFVDSGSIDSTLQLLPEGSVIHKFVGHEFNYSDALNQGLNYVSMDYVLIVSSHTSLAKDGAIAFALGILNSDEKIGAAYFDNEESGALRYTFIDKDNFNGFNGLWNTCSLVKVELLKRRTFRPEVFAAEDQEWARWLLYCENKVVARISGAGMDNSQNSNLREHSLRKRINEYVAIAYYANRDLLGLRNLVRVAYGVVKPVRRPPGERLFNLIVLFRLLMCYFVKPKYKSRYF